MMLRRTVRELRAAAELLGDAGRGLGAADPGPTAFGAAGLGALGQVGQQAYGRWVAALEARSREALGHAGRVGELAELVSRGAAGFAEAQDAAGRLMDRSPTGGVA